MKKRYNHYYFYYKKKLIVTRLGLWQKKNHLWLEIKIKENIHENALKVFLWIKNDNFCIWQKKLILNFHLNAKYNLETGFPKSN